MLEFPKRDSAAVGPILDSLAGDRMYAVAFILDHVQLQFDQHGLNAYSPLSVIQGETAASSRDPNFKNALCSYIGKSVSSVRMEVDCLVIAFQAGEIRLSLLDEDYAGPEAGQLFSPMGELIFRLDGVYVLKRGVV